MIDKDKIDVVHICVPYYLHPIISKYALEYGIHVLREKFMSIKYEDAVENDREPFISGKEALKIQKLICDIYGKGRFMQKM